MKKLMMIILAFVVCSYSCDMLCMDKLRHIEKTLDRIATLLEKQENKRAVEKVVIREKIAAKTYESRTNGRSLKAVLSDPIMFVDYNCEETCKTNYSESDIYKCIETLCKE